FRFGFKKQKVKTNKKALALYLPENLPDFLTAQTIAKYVVYNGGFQNRNPHTV
ncbi:hypothetical protein FHR24_003142, partial [Wenyingzhuangia heitensis]|nr:hypothetical protein [Wenyingzhuangia heitensis]